jgi:hypothetical protein
MAGLFALVFVAGGCFCILMPVYLFFKGRLAETWPSTSGQIESAEVKESSSPDDGSQFYLRVTYSYRINGTAYTSSKMSLADRGYHSPQEAANALRRYPVRSPVTVWFNPDDFTDALIERNRMPGRAILVLLFMGLMFIGMGVLVYSACGLSGCPAE